MQCSVSVSLFDQQHY